MRRKKYKLGTGIQGSIGTTIFDMSSNLLGGLTSKALLDLVGTINGVDEQEMRMVKPNTQPIMALGGKVPNTPVEVEGDETIELPNKTVAKVKGAKHEDGGVNMDLPATTKVYSDRLKVSGESLSDRKMNREKKTKKLEKYLQNNPTDKILKSTLERTQVVNSIEEEKDLKLQELANSLQDTVQTFMYGTGKRGVYNNGTPPTGVPLPEVLEDGTIVLKDLQGNILNNNYTTPVSYEESKMNAIPIDISTIDASPLELNILPITNKKRTNSVPTLNPNQLETDYLSPIKTKKRTNPLPTITPNLLETDYLPLFGDKRTNPIATITPDMLPISNAEIPGVDPIDFSQLENEDPKGLNKIIQDISNQIKDSEMNNMGMTRGDRIGMSGTFQAKYLPLLNTLMQRAGDTPNVNMYRDFGADAITAIEQAKQLATISRDSQLQDIQLSEAAARKRNRGSATSVNTQRSLDLSTDVNADNAIQQAYNAYAQQMMSLLGQQSGLENVQDQYVMAGEQARDLADRQDRDNYFTQLGQNLANFANFTQKRGKDLNEMQYREDFLRMLPEMSRYGIAIEYEKGKPVLKQKRNVNTTETELADGLKTVTTKITGGEDNNLYDLLLENLDEFKDYLKNK